MFRRPNGKLGFSFGRLIQNAVPNFASDNPDRDADISVAQQDMLFVHQLQTASPMQLDDISFRVAGVVARDSQSRQLRKALLKNQVLKPDTGLPDTTKIGPKFTHQVAFISVAAQRKLVGVLFFWEEEVIRWRLLNEEELEIETTIEVVKREHGEGAETLCDLNIALEKVRMKRRMKPSERKAAEQELQTAHSEQAQPPAYHGRSDVY